MTTKKKPSILFFDQYGTMGGAQTVLLELVSSALQKTDRIGLCFPHGGRLENSIDALFAGTIKKHSVLEPKLTVGKKTALDFVKMLGFIIYFFRFIFVMRSYDKIFINGARFFLPAAILSLFIKRDFYYFVHLDHSKIEKKIIFWILGLASTTKVVTTSRFVFSRLLASEGLSAEKVPKLGILESGLSKKMGGQGFVNRFKLRPEKFRTVIFGRVSPEKGQDIVLRIANQLPELEFHIVGSSDFAKADYFDALKCQESASFIFHGHILEIDKFVAEKNIHFSLVPSTWEEPFGLVAIESMAMSLITVVRRLGGLAEISEKTGALTFLTDAELILEIKKLLAKSADELRRLSEEQYRNVQRFYHSEKQSQAFQNLVFS